MKRLLLTCASTAVLAIHGQAGAQTASSIPTQSVIPPAQQSPDQVDPATASGDIVVTGIRRSLQQAADIKRDSGQILDVITAEDVGKLPDANVAEALQRVTGVQITRVFGEGQAVSVRGLQQVRVEVDGRTLLGFSSRLSPPENDQLGRSSGLDLVPSSLFGRLEVFKSPLASQAEGGLGGTVNLITPKPLDFKRTTGTVRVQGTYSENADKFEPGVTALFTTKTKDGRLGLLISGEYQKRTSVSQTLERNDFNDATYTTGGVTAIRQTPVILQYENFVVDRSRYGINGAVQFQATPDWVLTAEGLYSRIQTGRFQQQVGLRLPTSANPVTNPTVQDNFVLAGTTAAGTLTTYGEQRDEPATSQLYSLNSKYDNGQLSFVADGYYSRGTLDQSIEIITLQNAKPAFGTFDFRTGPVPSLVLTTTGGVPYDLTNIANFKLATNGVRANRLIAVLEEWTGKADVAYKFDGDVTVSAGVRYTDLHSTSNAYRSQVTAPLADVMPYISLTDGNAFLPDIKQTLPRTFLTGNPGVDYVFNTAQAAQPNPDPDAKSSLLPNDQRDYDLTERTIAGYAMVAADGTVFGIPAKANAGLRIAHTSLSVDTNQVTALGTSPVNDRNSYTKFLPSANAVFNVTHDFLVRISASQTLQRASIADLAPSRFFNATALSVSGGNAQLKPPTSRNADLSIEYYTGKSSLISGAVFVKNVRDFIANFSSSGVDTTFDPLGRVLQFTAPGNIGSARIKGFEIGAQQFLDFLPAPFDGFGFIANYTYSDSKDNDGFPLVAVSKNSYNLIGLFEKGPVSARIAYNYRDKAVFQFNQGRPSYIDGRSQLDAQVGLDILKNFQLSLQAQNLSPADSATVEYSVIGPEALNSYSLSERRFTIGLRAKF